MGFDRCESHCCTSSPATNDGANSQPENDFEILALSSPRITSDFESHPDEKQCDQPNHASEISTATFSSIIDSATAQTRPGSGDQRHNAHPLRPQDGADKLSLSGQLPTVPTSSHSREQSSAHENHQPKPDPRHRESSPALVPRSHPRGPHRLRGFPSALPQARSHRTSGIGAFRTPPKEIHIPDTRARAGFKTENFQLNTFNFRENVILKPPS